jgi:hypothetical protein
METQHSQTRNSVHHEEGSTSHTPEPIETHAPASEEGAIAPKRKSVIDTLPQELLDMILKDLDRVTIACLGLTCKALCAVHFARNGPVSLNEKSRYRSSDDKLLKAQVRTMSSILERCWGRKYDWWDKYQIYVPRGKAWVHENWLPSERGGEDHRKASSRRARLQSVKGTEDIRIKQEELSEWRLQRKELSRARRFAEHKMKGTLDEFYQTEELIEEASKVEVVRGERRGGISLSYLVEK